MLLPELLEMVDSEKLPLTVGVELSYLSEDKQKAVYEKMQGGYVPSKDEANKIRKLSDDEFDEFCSETAEKKEFMDKPKVLEEKKAKINERAVNKYLPSEIKEKPTELKLEYIQKALVMYSEYLRDHPEENAAWEEK